MTRKEMRIEYLNDDFAGPSTFEEWLVGRVNELLAINKELHEVIDKLKHKES